MALLGVFVTAIAHLFLKLGAGRAGDHRLALWLNAPTLTGYVLMLAVTLMNLYAYRVVPLRANVVFSPLVLLCVTFIALFILGERLSRGQIAGCALIIAGIAVFNL